MVLAGGVSLLSSKQVKSILAELNNDRADHREARESLRRFGYAPPRFVQQSLPKGSLLRAQTTSGFLSTPETRVTRPRPAITSSMNVAVKERETWMAASNP